jgi:hypothetical protein
VNEEADGCALPPIPPAKIEGMLGGHFGRLHGLLD